MAEKGLGVERVKFRLREVFCEDGPVSIPIYSSEGKIIHQELIREKTIGLSDFQKQEGESQLELSFLTPTRLKYEERIHHRPEFHIIIRNLLRRLSLMNYYHGNVENPELDYAGLIKKAEEIKLIDSEISWYDWERYSSRQKRKINMGGFVGRARYQGDFGPFYGLLKMGEILHIGKGAVFGLGKYEIQMRDGK
ncbi:MAG: CRISPR system precrRNA processing endoribonuclease RAMP protein Cas6 [Candidatus Omnitrophica bacterium]|nr:CRISPR system precrRNA processing endoribonuclease RAMP protein Cas6 [Candidatus Omnitrophota bacterium]